LLKKEKNNEGISTAHCLFGERIVDDNMLIDG
jgi:hypothetical protein